MSSINYAKAYGVDSLAAAIIFAVLYALLLALYIFQAVRRKTWVYFVLTLFCLMRVTAFALRSALAGSNAAATDKNALIAFEVIYNVGFFGVLYSAYTLVLERESLVDMNTFLMYYPAPLQLAFRITRRRILIHITLSAAVAVGIVGVVDIMNAKSQADLNKGTTLRSASAYIFLAVTCLLMIQTLALGFATMRTLAKETSTDQQVYSPTRQGNGLTHVGGTYGVFVLLAIAVLLLAREAFYGATVANTAQQTNEHLWYPLSAMTELLAVMLFAVPGLVPARDELPQEERGINVLA
ncbi:hypothetical protein DAEQUDRAFT_763158 [Daedalea quercina L-15889]|uniref:RTA1 like protein n=1 Tax=Daedalea quercina L-15889 TaxID=1314783 RepID=A0A165ST80_9APHY|nr:hypothetical protein DAEQUDRAFT_763158 [Daedalea quercina L-15889]